MNSIQKNHPWQNIPDLSTACIVSQPLHVIACTLLLPCVPDYLSNHYTCMAYNTYIIDIMYIISVITCRGIVMMN